MNFGEFYFHALLDLIDGKENHLLVVPDQTDKFIRLKLDEQP